MSENILMTGASGFLGKQFLPRLLSRDVNVYALTRPNGKTSNNKKISEPNLVYIRGDVTQPGLTNEDLPEINEVWNLAGLTDFYEKARPKLEDINIGGVENIVEFAKKRGAKLFHVSTAYVAGKTKGRVLEDELIESPEFRNPYEETKYIGEETVRASDIPYVIMRPSIIVGDSQTGEAESDKMVYGVIKLYGVLDKLMKRNGQSEAVGILGQRDATKNIIPVDNVADAMIAIKDNGQEGKTYHITNPEPTYVGIMHDAITESLGLDKLVISESPGNGKWRQRVDRFLDVYKDYMTMSDPVFDQSNMFSVYNGFTKLTKEKQKQLYQRWRE
ncbi:MAG: SDR family oxidoreductase [Nanoarchaeota archaeon]